MSFLIPTAYAHEVYVLQQGAITHDISEASPNPLGAISENMGQFIEWTAIVVVVLIIIFLLSNSKFLQRLCNPFLQNLKRYAPFIARLTLGASLFASGYYHALFGPEIPFSTLFSTGISSFISILFMLVGVCIIFGFLTRIMSVIGLLFFINAIFIDKSYMFTYANYLGEILLFIILGSGMWAIDNHVSFAGAMEKPFSAFRRALEPYSFLILRILFGTALLYASMYAKFLHSDLALDTVHDYNLTQFFHFTPLFLVLGAFLIETLIGLAFIFGFAIRFFALFFLTFLTMSILFFGESVWPHAILFGVAIVLFLHGYDNYTLGKLIAGKKNKLEPVL